AAPAVGPGQGGGPGVTAPGRLVRSAAPPALSPSSVPDPTESPPPRIPRAAMLSHHRFRPSVAPGPTCSKNACRSTSVSARFSVFRNPVGVNGAPPPLAAGGLDVGGGTCVTIGVGTGPVCVLPLSSTGR